MHKPFFAALLSLLIFAASAPCATPPSGMEKSCERRLNALADDNFTEFVSGGSLEMLRSDKRTFDVLSKTMRPALLSGYHLEYLGQGGENEYRLYHWRVKYNNGTKPSKATLVMLGEKVAGFWLE